MYELTVLYDAHSPLCCRIRMWMQDQRKFIQLDFVPAGSAEAAARYPLLDHALSLRELTVIADDGQYYRGPNAWLMCLWALHGYRAWAIRLSAPELKPFVHRFVARVSRDRFRMGR
ncbi:MAG: thiol-disulfide oxidoreductase DCC family protein [Blastocatellia bacterium]